MACHQIIDKPLPKPMLTCCQLDLWTIFNGIQNQNTSIQEKCIWKCNAKWDRFVQASVCKQLQVITVDASALVAIFKVLNVFSENITTFLSWPFHFNEDTFTYWYIRVESVQNHLWNALWNIWCFIQWPQLICCPPDWVGLVSCLGCINDHLHVLSHLEMVERNWTWGLLNTYWLEQELSQSQLHGISV